VEEIARRVHRDGEMRARLVAETASVLEAAPEVWVVSASPASIVRAALESIGRDPNRCAALEARFHQGVMQADVVRPIPYGEGKIACLRQKIGSRAIACALGDSGFDAPMLAAARIACAVQPKPALLERAPPHAILLRP